MIWKIRALLEARGIVGKEDAFLLFDEGTGDGPFIAEWDKAILGPKPTKASLNSLKTRADEIRAEEAKTPSDDLVATLVALRSTGASLDDLIDALTGKIGKSRIAGRPV